MTETQKRLSDFLDRIYIPKDKHFIVQNLMRYVTATAFHLRQPEKDLDEHRAGLRMLIVETKGKGTRETFHDYKVLNADFDTIGKQYALVYVYDDTGEIAKPIRIDTTSIKNTIIY